jgi:hypothetical protein
VHVHDGYRLERIARVDAQRAGDHADADDAVGQLPAHRNVPWVTVPTGSTSGAGSTGGAPELDPDGSDEVVSTEPSAASAPSASLLHAETETTRLDTTSAIKLT